MKSLISWDVRERRSMVSLWDRIWDLGWYEAGEKGGLGIRKRGLGMMVDGLDGKIQDLAG